MAWVDYEFYLAEYRQNAQPVIPEAEFLYLEKQARSNVNKKHVALEEVPDYLKECVCEVAEYLYRRNEANSADAIKSYSNDGYSETYVDQKKTPSEERAEIREIIFRHLSGTELHNSFVFAGV